MSGETGIRDLLTGLFTREYFDEIIGRELERSRRHDIALSVLSIVNTNLEELEGRREGLADQAVMETAKVLQRNLREADVVFRWEEDEFLALLFGTDAPSCKRKVEQLATLFKLWREGNGPLPHPIKVRIGAATHQKDIVFAAVLQAARAAARQQTRF
jgi:diguanylate cyclase (GGDEF)-like protein